MSTSLVSIDIDSTSTMDISDLNEFFSPDWADIDISPLMETEVIAVEPESLKTELETEETHEQQQYLTAKCHTHDPIDDHLCVEGSAVIATITPQTEDQLHDRSKRDIEFLNSSSSTAENIRDYRCKECSKSFRYKSKLDDHMVSHSRLRKFSCSVCGKSFALKHHLKQHSQTHKREKPFQCPVCLKQFCDRSYFALHSLKHYTSSCDISLPDSSAKSEEKQDCRYQNNQQSTSSTALKTKIQPEAPKIFTCTVCSKTFKTKGQMTKHFLIHSKKVPCLVCSQQCTSKAELSLHMKSAHKEVKPYSCDACMKCFRKKSQLNKHLLFHGGKAPFSCHDCSKKFADRISWLRHCQNHRGVKPFKCEICSKSFSLNTNLKEHLVIHSGIKRFSCTVCDKSFSRKGDLKKHNQSHLVDKPHLCEQCGKRFSRNYNLKLHYKNHHPGNFAETVSAVVTDVT